ncbi:MAG: endonuclease/exonuclease/phosphatase family protein [Colwellia sp.]|nr:endonuclease/exonuclease/phosphatase family protein [Colwellia sp.]
MAFETSTKLRLATFNVSMEALNYVERSLGSAPKVSGHELSQALQKNNQQIKNIAEIIQRINPDIILLNEFDYIENKSIENKSIENKSVDNKNVDSSHSNIHYFINNYLAHGQNGQSSVQYPYFYQGAVNTGVKINDDLNHDGKANQQPSDTHGFGYFEGHFGMVLLSKYPINEKDIRTFQHFKWRDMPNALQPIDPKTKQPWYSDKTWQTLRLSSKSHWDIPININGKTVHVLASHPTPPVFDGPEDRNGKRNHDEIRFWFDYINGQQGQYIYDDLGNKGGLAPHQAFVILGDQNASTVEGDAITSATSQGIHALLSSDKIQDPMPTSSGGEYHTTDNKSAKYHTAYWGMRADYVLPSALGFTIKNSGVFWPRKNETTYRLIENRKASSDHRLVWVDVELLNNL